MSSKRVWKLQDFIAHTGRTHCARLGEKSGHVLATGGEDKRVNVWKVGQPHAKMSLTGHNSSVECLVFDKQEEVLVVGCGGGSIQVWNLEYRKMAGTLAGHRTACGWVECHPYGEFFASGSADTNLKIWDLRRKSCIQTYKGHTSAITTIKFSPHGRWVATGGQDSQVKIWDLTAGKLMRDLDLHKAPITSIAFHPKDYVLATGSADRTSKLWSLENFQCTGSTELSSSPIQAVKFYEDGQFLSASQEALRVYNTDNLSVPTETIDVDWRGLQDMRVCSPEEKLIAVYAEASQVGVWVVDLSKKDSIANGRVGSAGRSGSAARSGVSSYGSKAPSVSDGAPSRPARENSAHRRLDRPAAEPPGETEETYRPSSSEHRQPRQPAPVSMFGELDSAAAPPPRSSPQRSPIDSTSARQVQSPKAYASVGAPTSPTAAPSSPMAGGSFSPGRAAGGEQSPNRGGAGLLSAYPPDRPPGRPPPVADDRLGGMGSPAQGSAAVGSSSPPPRSAQSPPRLAHSPPPRSAQSCEMPQAAQRPAFGMEQISNLEQEHPLMKSVLQRRLEQIRRLKESWAKGNLNNVSTALQMPQDAGAACDFLRAIIRRKLEASLNLDACYVLLPLVRELMVSKYDDFKTTSLQFTDVVLQSIGDMVAETRRSCAKIPQRQLDFAREERLKKCDACYDHFREILGTLPASDRSNRLRQALTSFLQSC